MTILHLDSSILGGGSVSRSLSAATVEHLKKSSPDATVVYRDLAASPLPHLSGAHLAAGQNPDGPQEPGLRDELATSGKVLEEFLQSDVVVLGVAFYNFSIPSQLKAWVDRIAVAGKTFSYSEKGAQGLCGDKRVILAISRGGFYGPGTPTESFEHAESYLKSVFTFLGVTQIEVIAAEGINTGADQREKSLTSALSAVTTLVA